MKSGGETITVTTMNDRGHAPAQLARRNVLAAVSDAGAQTD